MKTSRKDFLKLMTIGPGTIASLDKVRAEWTPIPEAIQVKRGDSRIPEEWMASTAVVELIDGRIFDRLRFEKGQTIPARINLYSTPVGQQCPYSHRIKTSSDTSMYRPGMLPAPQSMWVRSVSFVVDQSLDDRDLRGLWTFGWSFQIGMKIYDRGTLFEELHPSRGMKIARVTRMYPDTGGLAIANQMYFTMELTAPQSHTVVGDEGVEFQVTMEGLEIRGVQ